MSAHNRPDVSHSRVKAVIAVHSEGGLMEMGIGRRHSIHPIYRRVYESQKL